ncbi:MAG: MFS transporter [Pseudomonadota bacterium]
MPDSADPAGQAGIGDRGSQAGTAGAIGQRERAIPAPPLRFGTKLAFGFGAIAPGVIKSGFSFFLLIFYSQVVGLDAWYVGLAVTIALLFDAISDPVVGYWSDNLRSRWGRRHPFMYAAALPVSASFFFLWVPPIDASQTTLFWYLVILSIIIRTAVTFYHTPNSALAPDLTSDYNERTKLYSLRYLIAWTGANMLGVVMFIAVFPRYQNDQYEAGQFNPEAYVTFGLIGSLIILTSILVSSLGTHARIPHLNAPPPAREMSIGLVFRELFETLSERSFIALFVAALFAAVASGMSTGMSLIFMTYFWGFSEEQIGIFSLTTFAAAFIGFILAPIVSRTIGKKKGAMVVGLVAFGGYPLPIVLRLMDVLPPNGTPFIFIFVSIVNIVDTGLIICFQILFASMIADLVEQSELKTGRRSEGVFTAAETFVKKAVEGLGVLFASAVLWLAQVERGADRSEVSPESIWSMGFYYVPMVLSLWLIMIAVISTYRIDEEKHNENLRNLKKHPEAASFE